MACFHCCGTVEVKTERLNRWATGRQKSGAPSLRNQAGRPSSTLAVGRRWSSILNTPFSDVLGFNRVNDGPTDLILRLLTTWLSG